MLVGYIQFNRLKLSTQEIGTDDEHMLAEVHFDFEYEGKVKHGLTALIKQSVGAKFEQEGLEIYLPDDPIAECLRQDTYGKAMNAYYEKCIGTQANGIKIQIAGGGAKVTIKNGDLNVKMKAGIELQADPGPTW